MNTKPPGRVDLARRLFSLVLSLGAMARVAAAAPLNVTDSLATDGRLSAETTDWRLVFDRAYNGGPAAWYDLRADPGAADNLARSVYNYSQGVLFDYDVYLGTGGGNAIEHMTTMGSNADAGALQVDILEKSSTRLRLRQKGHPRLNNGGGPAGNPFPELMWIDAETVWTLYPTGKVAIDFRTNENPAGTLVDSGPGGGGKGVDAPGCCGFEMWVNAVGGADFRASGVWAGDTIESASGAWGPIRIAARFSPTQLILASPVPAGAALDYVVRRDHIYMETISIHADGDPSISQQCHDPATSNWQGGSTGDAIWDNPAGDGCGTFFRATGGVNPPLDGDVVLAHWARSRPAGSLLAFYEPWTGTHFGAFNDVGFTDISYTQLGKVGVRPYTAHHRHLLAQMGSTASLTTLPSIKSVAQAQPLADDYRHPFGEVLEGAFATDGEIGAFGYEPATAAYDLVASTGVACAAAAVGHSCSSATLRFDAVRPGGTTAAYVAPVVHLGNLFVEDGGVAVEVSTDAGATFSPLVASSFNLSSKADEAEVGAGQRVFQYLGSIPTTATGAARWAFRFRGPTRDSELIAGGGPKASDCLSEWDVAPTSARRGDGRRATRIDCHDGDPICDDGPAGDGQCLFRVGACFNVADPNLPQCTATTLATIEVVRPKVASLVGSVDAAARQSIEQTLFGADGQIHGACTAPAAVRGQSCDASSDCDNPVATGNGRCAGRYVFFNPPLTAPLCTARASVAVPLRASRGGYGPGGRVLRLKASTADPRVRHDSDLLRLRCLPAE